MLDKALLVPELSVAFEHVPLAAPPASPIISSSPTCQAEFISVDATRGVDVLAQISYGRGRPVAPSDITIDASQLNELPLVEVWRSKQAIEKGIINNIHFARNRTVLLGWLALPQGKKTLEATTFSGICNVLKLLEETGYNHLLRMWHYVPRINSQEHGLERYQAFCVGRQRAFAQGALTDFQLPAASAVGTADENLKIVFLASITPGIARENPRQISAYRYPRQYGPASPSFARATLISGSAGAQLLVSGTASIVGHESMHSNDITAQLDTILVNINRLIDETAKIHKLNLSLNDITLAKVYLRHPQDYVPVRQLLEKSLPKTLAVLYLQADICRENLSLEIEVICSCAS